MALGAWPLEQLAFWCCSLSIVSSLISRQKLLSVMPMITTQKVYSLQRYTWLSPRSQASRISLTWRTLLPGLSILTASPTCHEQSKTESAGDPVAPARVVFLRKVGLGDCCRKLVYGCIHLHPHTQRWVGVGSEFIPPNWVHLPSTHLSWLLLAPKQFSVVTIAKC